MTDPAIGAQVSAGPASVTSLEEFRRRRYPLKAAVARLDGAIARLDELVRAPRRTLTPRIERELLLIAHEVGAGKAAEATTRAERLIDLLEHPAALG